MSWTCSAVGLPCAPQHSHGFGALQSVGRGTGGQAHTSAAPGTPGEWKDPSGNCGDSASFGLHSLKTTQQRCVKTTHGSADSLSEADKCLLKNVPGLPGTLLLFRLISGSLLCPSVGAGLGTRPGMWLVQARLSTVNLG